MKMKKLKKRGDDIEIVKEEDKSGVDDMMNELEGKSNIYKERLD